MTTSALYPSFPSPTLPRSVSAPGRPFRAACSGDNRPFSQPHPLPSPRKAHIAPGRPFRAVWGDSTSPHTGVTGGKQNKKKPLPLPLRNGLTRLLGTSPPRSSPLPPPLLPSTLSSCPIVSLGRLLVSPLPPDRPAADRSKAITPWHAILRLHRGRNGPSPGLLLVLASRL